MDKRTRTAPVWNYFEISDIESKKAICKFCKNAFSYKSTITNLKLHLKKMHMHEDFSRREEPFPPPNSSNINLNPFNDNIIPSGDDGSEEVKIEFSGRVSLNGDESDSDVSDGGGAGICVPSTSAVQSQQFSDKWLQRLETFKKTTFDAPNEVPDSLRGSRPSSLLNDMKIYYAQQDCIELCCTTIKIGNYEYSPKAKVFISSNGITIIAPHLQDTSKDIALQMQLKEVLKILYYAGDESFPMIFIYAMNKVGAYIRKAIGMTEGSDLYYDPMSRVDPYKRITLFPEAITEDMKVVFKTLCHERLDALTHQEAVDIYLRIYQKLNNVCKSGSESSSQAENTNQPHAVKTTPDLHSGIKKRNKDNILNSDVRHEPTSSINDLVWKRNNSILTAESEGIKRPRIDSNDAPTHQCHRTVSAEETYQPESVSHETASGVDELFVAVTTEPYQDLSAEQATKIRKSLERKLKNDLLCPTTSAETSKVRFRDQAHFCDGVLKIQCENYEALAWIREAITFIPAPISNTTLVVKAQADVLGILCRIFVPDDDNTEIDHLIRLLAAQNTAVDVNSWSIIRGERFVENEIPGVLLYFRVPKQNVDTLRSQQRRLYWLMGNIFIDIKDDSTMTPETGTIKEEVVEDDFEVVNQINYEDTDCSIKEEEIEISEPDYHSD